MKDKIMHRHPKVAFGDPGPRTIPTATFRCVDGSMEETEAGAYDQNLQAQPKVTTGN